MQQKRCITPLPHATSRYQVGALSSPLNEPDHHHNDCYDQQNVNKIAQRIAGHQPQQPQNQQYYSDCPQHVTSPFSFFIFDPVDIPGVFTRQFPFIAASVAF
jgi:hypothetical protein